MPKNSDNWNKSDLAAQYYLRLKGARGVDESELWQHALFFAMAPEERCRFSLKTARSALSLRRRDRSRASSLSSAPAA